MTKEITVYLHSISHRHGTDIFASRTKDQRLHKLAEYCRHWWTEWENLPPNPPKSDQECVDLYFGEGGAYEEYYEFGTDSI